MTDLQQSVAEKYIAQHPGDASNVLDRLDVSEAAEAVNGVPVTAAAEVLHRMGADRAAAVLQTLPDERARDVMLAADEVRVASWLSFLPDEDRTKSLSLLPPRAAKAVSSALEFPPGTAGAIMDPRVAAFREEARVDDVLERIRRIRDRRITDIWIADEHNHLTGSLSLQELVGADRDTRLGSLAKPNPPAIHAMASSDDVVEMLNRYQLASLPVVSIDGELLGIIRHDALVRAAQRAAADDLQQMVGVGKEERALSGPIFTVKSRLPWLFINLLTAFAAASVVGVFDATISRFTALAVLMPVVAGQSGNTGAQALAVTSRGLALREIRLSHWWPVVRKEVVAALLNGVLVGSVTSVGVLIWSGSGGLAVVIGSSMIISMILAAIAGAAIPILLTALDRDPATASSIILTTITDITGFFSFLGLATVLADYIGP